MPINVRNVSVVVSHTQSIFTFHDKSDIGTWYVQCVEAEGGVLWCRVSSCFAVARSGVCVFYVGLLWIFVENSPQVCALDLLRHDTKMVPGTSFKYRLPCGFLSW